MAQINISAPACVSINLERGKVFYVAPGVSSTVTVAVPAESFGSAVSSGTYLGPYLYDREVTIDLRIGAVLYEVLDKSPASGLASVAIDGAIVDAAQAPDGGYGYYVPSSGEFAGALMLWNGSVWRMALLPGINVGLG